MSDLADLRRSFATLLADLTPLQHAMGQTGKKVALDVIEWDVGEDRKLSGLGRSVRLGAGYELGNPTVLHIRPKGLVILLDSGRKRSGVIRPKFKRSLSTPQGPRGGARFRRSRGRKTLYVIERRLGNELAAAVESEVARLIEGF